MKKIDDLYNRLMAFKDDPEFHKVGFGVAHKYNAWLKDLDALKDELRKEIIALGFLRHAGLKFNRTKGEETEATKTLLENYESFKP